MIDARAFDSAQVSYNMLNPSAAMPLPANYPAQDYGRLFDRTHEAGVGVIGIRVLAGGALSGSAERHPIASPPPEPIGSALNYDDDLARAQRLAPLVQEGLAGSLTELATRFAISHPAIGTILVGMATPQQFDEALAAVEKGPAAAGGARTDRRPAARLRGRAAVTCRVPKGTRVSVPCARTARRWNVRTARFPRLCAPYELAPSVNACASSRVSNTCGARSRSLSASPSLSRMKAEVV